MAEKIKLLGQSTSFDELFKIISSRKSFYIVRGCELDAEQLVNKVKDKGSVTFRFYTSLLKYRLEYKDGIFTLYYVR